jgi:hypothetical protein
MNRHVNIHHEDLAQFCRKHSIRRLSFFGSVLRSDFGPESDIDVLVDFEPGHTPGLLQFARMQRELSELMDGREVDLRTPSELSKYFRAQVLSTAQVQYAGG